MPQAGSRAPGATRDPALVLTLAVLWALLAFFVLLPLAGLLVRVVVDGGQLSPGSALAILANPHQLRALWNSLYLALLVGLAGTAIGLLFAFTATRARLGPGAIAALDAVTLLPLISPPFTTAIAMIFSFGPRGLLTYQVLGIKGFTVYGLGSTFFAETLTYFPIAYLTLRPVLAAIDANVEDMAFSLGASRARVFRTVTLPLAIPGLANAFLLLFAASLADFATPLILAGNSFPVLPTQAYLQITGLFDLRGGAVLSFALLVPAFIVYLVQRYWVSRRYYVTITGRAGARTSVKTVAPWLTPLLVGGCAGVAVVIAYFYALLFYASVVVALGANHAWTWRHYHVIFTDGAKAIRDTLVIAGLSMPLGGVYGVLVGYVVARKRFRSRQAMEVVSMLNYALPGTIVGIAYLIAFNDPPLALTGGALVIVACYVFRYSPTGIRATIAQLQQIDPSIEEASLGLGASTSATFRRVTLPLVVPAFFAGLAVVFIRSMTAISATIFLVSINWTLITVRILENMTELALGPAAAFSVLVVVIVYAVITGIERLLRLVRAPGAIQLGSILGS